MPEKHFGIKGLSDDEVLQSREKLGSNKLEFKTESGLNAALKSIVKEPMIILLFVAALIYFISGKTSDGFFLVTAIILVAFISLYQDVRSRNALAKLKQFSQSTCKVIRNGITTNIKSDELVIGDCLIVEEGTIIAADGIIIHSNDFSVNESILTGESLPAFKDQSTKDNYIYTGTSVTSGLAIATITNTGNNTKLGKIGKSLESIDEEKTPLELQINRFVKTMVLWGMIVFLIVWIINYYKTADVIDSLLKALTLAMSLLPEEIPVAFTTFMALGAYRLMKMGIVVKQMKTVETLGSATVICIDKTGTITENKMTLAKIFLLSSLKSSLPDSELDQDGKELLQFAMWASEPIPFDPMELSLHEAYKKFVRIDERHNYNLIHEYPLSGQPPMMTHIFENNAGQRIIAAKGAPEALINVSNLTDFEKSEVYNALNEMASQGYRVLGVGKATHDGYNFEKFQQDYKFQFIGLVAFYDPPKKNIGKVLNDFYAAGINVKLITGDNTETTTTIARQIAFRGYDKSISGEELMKLNDTDLQSCVTINSVFTRMFPEAKLRIINALKQNNQVVAMTGDGVNDGPALKAAHIGIAMGKRGTEIAKTAASLILADDDLSKMVTAIAAGRKIYINLKKAIQYIISIHIPIILTVFIPLALGWIYSNIFSPVHIIFLELIMGPTCSIIYENEPIEENTMIKKPRPLTTTFFSFRELSTSIIQGLIITAGTLFAYQFSVYQHYDEALTRTMVFTVLIIANIFLTLINRSFYYSIVTTLKYKNRMVFQIIVITISLVGMMIFLPSISGFFGFSKLNAAQLLICLSTGFISVIWFEIVKWKKRIETTSVEA
jgi:P-type Ca2+ transporter type 2C